MASQASLVGLASTYGTVSTFSVVLNTWIFGLCLKERLWQTNKFFVLIGCLTFADALQGITYIIFTIELLLAEYAPALSLGATSLDCYASLFPMVFGIVLQQLITAVIAVERLVAVCFPVTYYSRADLATSITAGISVLFSFLVAVGGFGATVGGLDPNCAPTTALLPGYAKFFQMLRFVLFFGGIAPYLMLLVSFAFKSRSSTVGDDEHTRKKQARLTRTVVILVAVYISTTGTAMGVAFAAEYAGFAPPMEYWLGQIIVFFDALNCLLNVFVFPLKLEELREPLKAQLNALCCGRIGALNPATRVHKIGTVGGADGGRGHLASSKV